MRADEPILWAENVPAYDAFFRLNLERFTGMDEGPVPPSKIREYARDEGLELEELEVKIMALDRFYLEHRKKQREQEKERKRREQERAGRPGRRR